nr:phage tail protein [uncultured Pseudomonas sp.]
MPWYKTGTVSVTQNSNAVIGTGTAFIANSRVGDGWRGPDGRWYEVTNIASNTALSISPNYEGPTVAGGFYSIMPVQGYQKDLSDQVRAILNDYGEKLAALGTTGNYDILPVVKGGTGGANQAGARSGLGLGSVATLTAQTTTLDATAGRALLVGAGGLLGESPSFVGNIDDRNAVPFGCCFIGPSTAGTKPSGVSYGVLITQGATGNQGTHQELCEITGATGVTTNTWHRDQYGNGGAWGPWRRRYSTNNIVGTVAQTSSAPTGAIIERGTNASGEYVRYADGTQICWKRIGTSSVNSASGSLFLSNAVGSGSYPMAFISIPTVSAMACVSGYQWALWAANASEPTATAWGSYYAAAAASTLQGALINIIAVGRWF